MNNTVDTFFERLLNCHPVVEEFDELTHDEYNLLSLDEECKYTRKLSAKIVAEQNEAILQYYVSILRCDVD